MDGLTLFLLAAVSPPPSTTPATPPPAASAAGYKHVVFSDEFDSIDVSPDGSGTHKWFNGLWYLAQVTPDRFQQHDGFITISTHVQPTDRTTASSLTTWAKGKGSSTLFRYGYFEARIRFQQSPYNWPAFWLLSEKRTEMDKTSPVGKWCELDAFEGGRPGYFQGTAHNWRDGKSASNANQHFRLPVSANFGNWNTVGMLWSPGRVSWYFNDVLVGSAPSPRVCDQQQMFLVIGSQKRAGGLSPESVDVDWVRVYR